MPNFNPSWIPLQAEIENKSPRTQDVGVPLIALATGIPIDGEKLAAMWRDSLLPQELFAAKMGLGRSGLGRLVSPGVHGVHGRRLVLLAESLGIDVKELQKRLAPDKSASVAGKKPTQLTPSPASLEIIRHWSFVWKVSLDEALDRIVASKPATVIDSSEGRAGSTTGAAGSAKGNNARRAAKPAGAGKASKPR